MEAIWSRLRVLREKKSIGGWALWFLLVVWNIPGNGQNFAWWRQHILMLTAHSGLISWFLAVGGLIWMLVILLWPIHSNSPWLQFEREGLKIQNTSDKPIFDVRVKIGEKSFLESDVIPRIEGKSWVPCKRRDQIISIDRVGQTVVEDILSDAPQGTTPALITYRNANGREAAYRLALKSKGTGLQFFLPTKEK